MRQCLLAITWLGYRSNLTVSLLEICVVLTTVDDGGDRNRQRAQPDDNGTQLDKEYGNRFVRSGFGYDPMIKRYLFFLGLNL